MKRFRLIACMLLVVFVAVMALSACKGTNDKTGDNTITDNTPGTGDETGDNTGEQGNPQDNTGDNTQDNTGDNNGDDTGDDTPAGEVYTLPLVDGYNQLSMYWTYPGGVDLETTDVWMWWDGKEGSGYLMHKDAYGAKVVVNVPADVEQVGFIVRRDCSAAGGSSWGTATKDYEQDRYAVITGRETHIYLKTGDGNQYKSEDGGKTLEQIKLFTIANLTGMNTVQYSLTPAVKLTNLSQVKVYEGEKEIEVSKVSSLNNTVTTGVVTLASDLDISKAYRMEIEGYGSKAIVPLGIFGTQAFADAYNYDGDDLGAVLNGDSTTFKVWAPTASAVVLNLFAAGNGGEAQAQYDMEKGEKGVWHYTAPVGHGTYYTYTVTTSVGTQEAVDPYAKAVGVNGNRGMVVDLARTNPTGWESETYADNIEHYTDAIIWEVHVRDFSNKIADSQYKGKYLAFTERGLTNASGVSVGVDYLVDLGITHVHIMPAYDYATVDEASSDPQYNWGYDPKNYNVPEGSYSTDPYHGEVRINEFKQMVQALHAAGLAVVMDVVYNHTYDANSNFNKIVPYYYYRYTATGANSSASGCGNDTASERYMFSKFMADSVAYWTTEYKVDGFRFDLMGLHNVASMQAVEQAVHAINPKAIIYGEGWTMGSTVDGSAQANQTNIKQITATEGAAGAIAVFNDVIRDGLKGSVFNAASTGYISGNASNDVLAKLQFALKGSKTSGQGWTVQNAGVINYISCHDNLTLWDKLLASCPNAAQDDMLAMQRLGAAIVFAAPGTPFMQAGEEMLRTKGGDENSYKSPDAVNNLDWDALVPGSDAYQMVQYYKALIALRKGSAILRAQTGVAVTVKSVGTAGAMTVSFDNHSGHEMVLLLNPTTASVDMTLSATYNVLLGDGETASGTVAVPARSAIILEK